MAIPRIGHEVVVDFVEGDPDQPIITGRTYNANNLPPYKLAQYKTRMVIKSKTHKGQGHNELYFDDKINNEEIYIHAQKDQNNIVLNDETTEIGNDRTEHVAHDEKVTIDHNKTIPIRVIDWDMDSLLLIDWFLPPNHGTLRCRSWGGSIPSVSIDFFIFLNSLIFGQNQSKLTPLIHACLDATSQWWQSHRHQFSPGTRYLSGLEVNAENLRNILLKGNQRQRQIAAWHLFIKHNHHWLDCGWPHAGGNSG